MSDTPPEDSTPRKKYLLIPAALVAYGIWRYTGLRHDVDASGVHYHCQTIWNTLVNGEYPSSRGVIDAGSRSTLSDSQIWDLANRACHQDASDSAFMNALWLVPVAYWLLLNLCRWFIRDVDGSAKAPQPKRPRVFVPLLTIGLALLIADARGLPHVSGYLDKYRTWAVIAGVVAFCAGAFWSAYAWAHLREGPKPEPPPPTPRPRQPAQRRSTAR